ncbi:MAG TPA: hypothetical protein VF664_01905, partial [Cystobacter sp.]
EPDPSECLAVMWWLFEREYAPHVRLHAPGLLEDARAALFEVAYELWDAQRPDIPDDERWTPARWARLDKLAGQADEGRQGPDGERVCEALRELIQRYGMGTRVSRGWWAPSRLTQLVQQVREVLG